MTERCVHEDEHGRCECPSHVRKGKAARLFGLHPACILIGASISVECLDQQRPAQVGMSGTIWDKIGAADDAELRRLAGDTLDDEDESF
jgi:hypothetical protein